jgi:hypothetical protein
VSFIEKFLEHTREYESPNAFWKYSAYATISAVLRDNCYRRQGDSALFPNIYVLILADSGIHRKGRPVELSEQFVSKVKNTKVISGRASIQAILDELASTETDRATGAIVKGGAAIFYAPELSAGIVSDPQAVSILTDIYDYKPNSFTSRLRSAGKFRIDKMIFSMLAASNADLLKSVYDISAVRGGLLARTFLVCADEFRPSNSLMRFTDRTGSFDTVYKELLELSKLTGEFTFEDAAIDEFEAWYKPFRESYKNKADKSGIVSRIHTGAVKLSMLLAANAMTLRIGKDHIEEAIADCLALLPNYNNFIMSTGKATGAEAGAAFLMHLLESPGHTSTKKQILRVHWSNMDIAILDEVVLKFELSGHITRLLGKDEGYVLTPYALQQMGVAPPPVPDPNSKP